MKKTAGNKLKARVEKSSESCSLDVLVGRREDACEQERWRVDEWCEARECWWVLNHHETYAKAADQLDNLAEKCAAPKRRWRVVWIRERVQLQSESPNEPSSATAGKERPNA